MSYTEGKVGLKSNIGKDGKMKFHINVELHLPMDKCIFFCFIVTLCELC